MRKLLSILLLAVFGLPVAAPLFALGQTAESRLPACCRRAGDHHCAGNMGQQMEMADSQASPNPRFAPITPRCPYTPGTIPAQHSNPGRTASLIRLDAAPAAQTFIAPRILLSDRGIDDPSLPKRGPPISIIS